MLMLGLIEARGIVVQRVKRELVVATEGFDTSARSACLAGNSRLLSPEMTGSLKRSSRRSCKRNPLC